MENCMQALESLIFLVKKAVKFRKLQISKILNTDTNNIFNSFQGYVHMLKLK